MPKWLALDRRRWRILGIVACLCVSLPLLFGASTWLTLRWGVSVPEVSVPDVTGASLSEAKTLLQSAGLICEVSSQRYDPNEPSGNVLEQFPSPEARLQPGRRVRVVVSRGPERALVPELTGSSLRRATLALRAAKLERGLTSAVHHDQVALGRVVSQTVSPGTEAFPGDEVGLLVSAGPRAQAWVMPDLTGHTVAAAKGRLERIGVRRIRVAPADAPETGTIGAQQPPAGARITADDRVELRVSMSFWAPQGVLR
jgi:serine/threonine-protein kinase